MKTRLFFLIIFLAFQVNTVATQAGNLPVAYHAANAVMGSNLRRPPTLTTPTQPNIDQHLRLQLYKDPINIDETVIVFSASASPAYVRNEDVLYLPGTGVVSLSSLSGDGIPLAINELPFTQQSEVIPLQVHVAADGTYQLNLTEAINIPQLFEVWLMDAYKKDSVDIIHNPQYSFMAAAADTASVSAGRFKLSIRVNPAYAYKLLGFAGAKVTGGAQLNWTTTNENNYTGFLVQRSIDGGKTYINLDSLQSTGAGSYSYLDINPSTVSNQYRLLQQDFFGNNTYSNVVILNYREANANSTLLSLYPNPVNDVINLGINANSSATGPYTITIINNKGGLVKSVTTQQSNWQNNTTGLTPGVYILQVMDNTTRAIIGTNKFIKL